MATMFLGPEQRVARSIDFTKRNGTEKQHFSMQPNQFARKKFNDTHMEP